MSKESEIKQMELNGQVAENGQEFAIDRLLEEFHTSVESVAGNSEKYAEMMVLISEFNPHFVPIEIQSNYPETKVVANVVAGIYAPLIHAFAKTILKNIEAGKLPNVVIAPPRDAIPIANALIAQAGLKGIDVAVLAPHVNRNTAGIANNQKEFMVEKSPHLDALLDQAIVGMNGTNMAVEVETGIYGTTSLVMAKVFKEKKLDKYFPIKFYGLGPNVSFVHGILSGGQEWIAERAEEKGLVDPNLIQAQMVLLDTMEELGMEKFYKSVEALCVDESGKVKPVIISVSEKELEIATITNQVIIHTAAIYADMDTDEVERMLKEVPYLTHLSKAGFPLTLTEPIPSMDSKEEHYNNIRSSKLFDYPDLIL